jgi:hypothetical protein
MQVLSQKLYEGCLYVAAIDNICQNVVKHSSNKKLVDELHVSFVGLHIWRRLADINKFTML